MSAIARTGSAVAVCLGLFGAGAAAQDVTYTKDVAPILMANCVTCHRPGEVAPMSQASFCSSARISMGRECKKSLRESRRRSRGRGRGFQR